MDVKARARFWIGIYEYHQQELNAAVAVAYAKDTATMDDVEIERAWEGWRSENNKAPLPADLLKQTQFTDDEIAELVADAMWRALTWDRWPTRKDNANMDTVDEKAVYSWLGNVGAPVMIQLGGFHVMKAKIQSYSETWAKRDWKRTAMLYMKEVRFGRRERTDYLNVKNEYEVLKLIDGEVNNAPKD